MTHGMLGIVVCPMLEDKLVYNSAEDPEPKDVYVPESSNTGALRRNLEARGVTFSDLDGEIMHTDN